MKRQAPDPVAAHTVDTDQLSRSGSRLTGRLPVAGLQRLAPQLASAAGEIEYELAGELDERARPAATLRAHGTLTQRCDLCERDVTLPLDIAAQYYFVADARSLDELPLEGDDEREPLVGGRRFDVAGLVEDEAILALPISPRHPACEAELAARGAVGDGAAVTETPEAEPGEPAPRPNPFAVLAKLKGRVAK